MLTKELKITSADLCLFDVGLELAHLFYDHESYESPLGWFVIMLACYET